MSKSPTARTTAPETVWLTGGCHIGPAPQQTVRENLRKLKDSETIQDFLELGNPETAEASETAETAGKSQDSENSPEPGRHVFEARWHVADADADAVTVRARLTIEGREHPREERRWTLAAEADRPWDHGWPSPATVFWPEKSDDDESSWDHDVLAGLRLRDINPLPKDEKALRRLLRETTQRSWNIHVVVHEAMTTDDSGRLPLARLLPPGLRHRVVEHRAAPEQFHAVNWALGDLGAHVPRGGAVILPGAPARLGYEEPDFTVRSVFLDGSEPTGLLEKVVRYAALPWPLPQEAEETLATFRQDWSLLTLEEELARARALVDSYAEALDAMTKSRDLYREATELAHAALAEIKEFKGPGALVHETSDSREGRPLQRLTRTFQRVTGSVRARDSARDDVPPDESE